jgi:hypothetical protein
VKKEGYPIYFGVIERYYSNYLSSIFFILRVFHNKLSRLHKSKGNLQFHRYINEGRQIL